MANDTYKSIFNKWNVNCRHDCPLCLTISDRKSMKNLKCIHYSLIYTVSGKSKPNTVYHRNVTIERILSKFRTLDSEVHCVRKKSKPDTMYHRNVKSECILCKFCMLYSEVFCEICTKFRLKILSDGRVINL